MTQRMLLIASTSSSSSSSGCCCRKESIQCHPMTVILFIINFRNEQTNSSDDSIGDNNNKQTKINYNDKDDVEIIYCSVFH